MVLDHREAIPGHITKEIRSNELAQRCTASYSHKHLATPQKKRQRKLLHIEGYAHEQNSYPKFRKQLNIWSYCVIF